MIKNINSKVITVGCDDLKDSIVNGEEGDIEGAATKIEDQDILLALLLVHPVGDGSSGGLVDDPHHGHTGDDTSILGGLNWKQYKSLFSVDLNTPLFSSRIY